MVLPYFQTGDKDLSLLQTNWKTMLDPLLKNPLINGILLKDIFLINGSNIINHRLGRKPQGFFLVDEDAAINIFRTMPFNELTLTLQASATATVALYVF